MRLEHWDADADGPLSEAALREKLEALGYSVTRYTYPAGTFFADHEHDVDKIDAVLHGRFRLSMDGRSVVLERGNYLYVPRGCVHSAEVIGDETVVSLDAVRRR